MRNKVCIEAEIQARLLYLLCDRTAGHRGFQFCRDIDRCLCLGSGKSPSCKHNRYCV